MDIQTAPFRRGGQGPHSVEGKEACGNHACESGGFATVTAYLLALRNSAAYFDYSVLN